MRKKAKNKWLTKKEFIQIKRLLEIGISKSDITRVLNRSHPLVSRVSRSEDWGEYVAKKREYAEGKRKEREEKREAIVSSETRPTVNIAQEFVAIREALANIERAVK